MPAFIKDLAQNNQNPNQDQALPQEPTPPPKENWIAEQLSFSPRRFDDLLYRVTGPVLRPFANIFSGPLVALGTFSLLLILVGSIGFATYHILQKRSLKAGAGKSAAKYSITISGTADKYTTVATDPEQFRFYAPRDSKSPIIRAGKETPPKAP
jgi:hypothetical protein